MLFRSLICYTVMGIAAGCWTPVISQQSDSAKTIIAEIWSDPVQAVSTINEIQKKLKIHEAMPHILQADSSFDSVIFRWIEDSVRREVYGNYQEMYTRALGELIRSRYIYNTPYMIFHLMMHGREAKYRQGINLDELTLAFGLPDEILTEQRANLETFFASDEVDKAEILGRIDAVDKQVKRMYPGFYQILSSSNSNLHDRPIKKEKDEMMLVSYCSDQYCFLFVEDHDTSFAEILWLAIFYEQAHLQKEKPTSSFKTYGQQGSEDYSFKPGILNSFQSLANIISRNKKLLIIADGPVAQISWGGLPWKDGFLVDSMQVRMAPGPAFAFGRNYIPVPGDVVYFSGSTSEHAFPGQRAFHAFGTGCDRGSLASSINYLNKAPLANLIHLEAACQIADTGSLAGNMIFSDATLSLARLSSTRLAARLAVVQNSIAGDKRYRYGEGPQALTRAFAAAGCPSLITNLWEVEGRTNELILADFYQKIKAGQTYAEALQNAQLAYLDTASEKFRHPYYWAGLVLSGAAGETQRSSSWWLILVASLMLMPLLWAWRIRIRGE
ncbi:MAG: CHAT domain-containing protein [Bacteroidia bacterium]